MPHRWGPVLALVAIVATMASACGDRELRGARAPSDATPKPELTLTLAQSREHFEQQASYRASYRFVPDRGGLGIAGEGAFSAGQIVYGRIEYLGFDPGPEGVTDLLYLPPDMYFHQANDAWMVMSPWYQGIKPEEQAQFAVDVPIIDYPQFTRDLRDIRQQPDNEASPGGTERYRAEINVTSLQGFAPGAPIGVTRASVDLWIEKESKLPTTIEIHIAGDDPTTGTVEFSDYGAELVAPAPPENATVARDYQLPQADCTGDAFASCLEAQTDVANTQACEGAGRRVCLVPLGRVAPALIEHLAAHYRDYYGLDVRVMSPAPIPEQYADPLRDQIDAHAIIEYYLGNLAPEAFFDLQATMIAVTGVDIFQPDSHYSYVLGYRGDQLNPHAVVSTFRMDPMTYGEAPDDRILFSRARKMVSKYVGFIYYGLSLSQDPNSPMYDMIRGPDALDRMREPLPVQ